MTDIEKDNLKQKIIKEMIIDYSNTLIENFNLAKQFIRITKEGQVEVLFKDKLNGIDQILLYLIGKLYAKEAELTTKEEVSNKELMERLSIPKGSLLPWIKQLRDGGQLRQINEGRYVYHTVHVHLIEKILKFIERKLKKV